MSIGNNIKNLRLKYSLSQKELAEIAGVSDKTVSAWEQNRIIPRMGPIQRMADHFGIKKSDIIEPFPISLSFDTERIVKNDSMLSDNEKRMVQKYRNLNFDNRRMIDNLMEKFLAVQAVAQ